VTATTGELLKFICDYQHLVGRRNVLRASLSTDDLARLAALEELLANTTATDPTVHRRFARVEVSLHATVEVGARAASVTIGNIGAGGAFVKQADAERPDLQRGELTMVTVSDPTVPAPKFFRVTVNGAGASETLMTGLRSARSSVMSSCGGRMNRTMKVSLTVEAGNPPPFSHRSPVTSI
jgi:hypothetical protein